MVPGDGPISLGTKWAGVPNGNCWNGKIDEVTVLSRGITQADVKEVMKGFDKIFAIDSTGKIAITLGNIKMDYQLASSDVNLGRYFFDNKSICIISFDLIKPLTA